MKDIAAIKQPVINDFLRFEEQFKAAFQSDNQQLTEIYTYLLTNVGKQVRPTLTLLCSKLCGTINDTAIQAAVALELMHTASLLHDDVVDEAKERRGNPSVYAQWGNKTAILSGDYLLAASFLVITGINNSRIWMILANVGKLLAEGELLQLNKADGETVSETHYFKVIERKTATLFSACTEVGAISAGADNEQIKRMREFGENLGIGFQIKDDIFDYSDSSIIGKPTGNDLREGKITLPLIYALKTSSESERQDILLKIQSISTNESYIAEIQQFARDKGGITYAEEKMAYYKNKALEALSSFPDNEEKEALISILDFATARNY
ncbi:polyprenyl synthetase family protein [Paludibacter sp.]|uniref:polyprenyl synthetase family protein n=1 Tax=Paludibacter sp. TaxID=1898105 RepID=UPI0013540115|nr:polyprenyl synthetase family protein [Paludibacter sp.]MTK52230.1 polyprenyl synthetase family protein [Paludibacter sp.]